jgi:hypothetical protein
MSCERAIVRPFRQSPQKIIKKSEGVCLLREPFFMVKGMAPVSHVLSSLHEGYDVPDDVTPLVTSAE